MREITCEELKKGLGPVRLIDVRTPEEWVGELGHIEKSELVPLGPDLMDFFKKLTADQRIIFVCRSGARSGQATLLAEELGFNRCYNLVGGMLRWNELGYPVEKGTTK